MDKRIIVLLCIFTNLLVGNGIIYLWASSSGSVNWNLMIGMSLSCILCYLVVFKYINFRNWHILNVLLLSLLTCVVIELIGCSFAAVITGSGLESNLLYNTLKGLVVGFFMGIMGNLLMFPITITLGIANIFWFQKYKRIALKESNRSTLSR